MELKYEGNKKNKENEQVLMAIANGQVILGLCPFYHDSKPTTIITLNVQGHQKHWTGYLCIT